jgi:hypothetical protein
MLKPKKIKSLVKGGILLLAYFFSTEGHSQTWNRLYGNNYSCMEYLQSPGYETIYRSKHDTFFIITSNYTEQGYNAVLAAPDGSMLSSYGENQIKNYLPPHPYWIYINGEVIPTCGKVTTPTLYETYLASCMAKNGKMYFGGVWANTNSLTGEIRGATANKTKFGFGGGIPRSPFPYNKVNYEYFNDSPLYVTTNNRCVKMIPDDTNICMLGIIDGYRKDTAINFTSLFEPSFGVSKFNDSTFYLMRVDTGGKKQICNAYLRSGAKYQEKDGMSGILRDTQNNYATVGHLRLLGRQDQLHIAKFDPVYHVLGSMRDSLIGRNLRCEGQQIISAPNGDYIVLGNYLDSGRWTPFLMCINHTSSSFAINWCYRYRLKSSPTIPNVRIGARAWNVIRTSANDYMIVGTSDQGLFMLRVDNTGNGWIKTYGGERGYSVVETSTHGFAAAGARYRCESSLQDLSIYCVKTDGSGTSFCASNTLYFSPHDTINWGSAIVTLSESGSMAKARFTNPFPDNGELCVFGGTLEEYPVCPECCFPSISSLITRSNTAVNCIGDTLYLQGNFTSSYRFEWYVNGKLFSKANSTNYVFPSEGSYDFTVRVILKSNPKCVLKYCWHNEILPGNKGFSYADTTGHLWVCFTYNDTSAYTTAITHYKWDFGDGTTLEKDKVSDHAGYIANENPCHHYSDHGLFKVCLTITTSDGTYSCVSTVCQDICLRDQKHNCCNCQ